MNPTIFVPLVFFVIALVFSMLGMGGSQLYIPILFWAGLDFKTEAIPLGMLLNVINSGSATVTYARRKLIVWRTALPLAGAMMAFAPLGVWLNVRIPVQPLLVFFAAFTAAAGLLMLSGWRPADSALSPCGRTILGAAGGSGLGLVAGLIGRGGGSFVVPLLVIFGVGAKAAAATSAFVVTCSGISSLVSHVATGARPSWGWWVACVASVFAGSQIGSRWMADRMKPRSVKLVFGIVLLGVAAVILVKDVLIA